MVIRVKKGGPRRNASSAKQSRGSKVRSAIQGNIPGDSTNKDTRHEGMGQRGTMKYLRKNYYHHIKFFVANSLTTLMSK